MIKATLNDRSHVVYLLEQAFERNQSVNYIVKPDGHKRERIRALMEYSFDICFHAGEVYLSADRNACALVLHPDAKTTNLRSIWLDIRLIIKAIGIERIGFALKREAAIKKRQVIGDVLYLWFIGVDPKVQHQGIGSELLRDLIVIADYAKRTLCLETSTSENMSWYERFGFTVYDEIDLGYRLFFFKRECR